jgi:hypothetical protein
MKKSHNPLLVHAEVIASRICCFLYSLPLLSLFASFCGLVCAPHAKQIGKAKPPVVNLPPEGFVYGQKSYSIEGDNAKNGQSRFNFLDAAVLTKWVEHAPNDASRPGKDFKRANKFSVKAGLTPYPPHSLTPQQA